jgi:hypothetical protein
VSKIIRPIHAQRGEIVRIIWHHEALKQIEENHTAPPDDVWRKRLEDAKALGDLTPKEP